MVDDICTLCSCFYLGDSSKYNFHFLVSYGEPSEVCFSISSINMLYGYSKGLLDFSGITFERFLWYFGTLARVLENQSFGKSKDQNIHIFLPRLIRKSYALSLTEPESDYQIRSHHSAKMSWWQIVVVINCRSDKLSFFRDKKSWWQIVVVTNCRREKLSEWRIVVLTNCRGDKKSWWRTVVLTNCRSDKELRGKLSRDKTSSVQKVGVTNCRVTKIGTPLNRHSNVTPLLKGNQAQNNFWLFSNIV